MNKLTYLALFGVSQMNAKATVGVNAGGWMVLEPWITPSLFYRFTEKTKGHVGMDSYTFCEALGPEEGNKVMRAHWDAWYTEDHIKQLKEREVEIIRLPIGDWTLDQYGPYVGCMDGAAEKITWFMDMCAKYDIKVLMDVHAMKDSQNGYDNSGKASDVVWTSDNEFEHWPNQAARWFGNWNHTSQKYDDINYEAQEWGLKVHENLLKKWGKHKAFYAFEPLNEPQFNPITEVLKKWYKKSRELVREHTNNAWFVFHNAQLDFNPEVWNGLFDPKDDRVAVDVHYYQAFIKTTDPKYFTDVKGACNNYHKYIAEIADGLNYPVWIGEWSLATDVCAHWLGGFNDANTVAQQECARVDCPKPYVPDEVAVDCDRTKAMLGPFGDMREQTTIQNGKCTSDSLHFSDDEVKEIAKCALDAFDGHVEAQFMWTAHNEIEPRWDYVKAYDNGWFDRKESKSQDEFMFMQA